jgi:hypothetical protein
VFDGLFPFGLDSGILNVGGEPQAVTIGVLLPDLSTVLRQRRSPTDHHITRSPHASVGALTRIEEHS